MTLLGSLDNFYLTKGELEASPSRRDGIPAAAERELRHYCADVVAEAAVLLRLPQVVAATAQVLVQRFYCKRSLKKFDPKVRRAAATAAAAARVRQLSTGPRPALRSPAPAPPTSPPAAPPLPVQVVAMAAFWLAAKLEEVIEIDNPSRLTLRNVITVVDRVTRRRAGQSLAVMDPYSQAGAGLLAGCGGGCWGVGGWCGRGAARCPGQPIPRSCLKTAPCASSLPSLPTNQRVCSPLLPCSATTC